MTTTRPDFETVRNVASAIELALPVVEYRNGVKHYPGDPLLTALVKSSEVRIESIEEPGDTDEDRARKAANIEKITDLLWKLSGEALAAYPDVVNSPGVHAEEKHLPERPKPVIVSSPVTAVAPMPPPKPRAPTKPAEPVKTVVDMFGCVVEVKEKRKRR